MQVLPYLQYVDCDFLSINFPKELSWPPVDTSCIIEGKIFLIREWCKMRPYFSYFALLLVIPLRAEQSQLDGSRGLKQGVNVQGNRASYGNFAVHKFHRLQGSVSSSSVVSNYRECALSCVNTLPCFSFNVAATPIREDGKYQCELLNVDKYSANPGQLVISQEHHHYSIKV